MKIKFMLFSTVLFCLGCSGVCVKNLQSPPRVAIHGNKMQMDIPHPTVVSDFWVSPRLRRHDKQIIITAHWTARETPWQYKYDLKSLGISEKNPDNLSVQWIDPDGTATLLYP